MIGKLFDFFPDELKREVVELRTAQRPVKAKKVRRKSKTNVSQSLKSDKKVPAGVKPYKKEDGQVKQFAFSRLKKLPLNTERQVLSAMNHFFNVKDTTKEDLIEAKEKILKAAETYKICTMGFNKKSQDVGS